MFYNRDLEKERRKEAKGTDCNHVGESFRSKP
jgi:hypothetical protein